VNSLIGNHSTEKRLTGQQTVQYTNRQADQYNSHEKNIQKLYALASSCFWSKNL